METSVSLHSDAVKICFIASGAKVCNCTCACLWWTTPSKVPALATCLKGTDFTGSVGATNNIIYPSPAYASKSVSTEGLTVPHMPFPMLLMVLSLAPQTQGNPKNQKGMFGNISKGLQDSLDLNKKEYVVDSWICPALSIQHLHVHNIVMSNACSGATEKSPPCLDSSE